MLRLYSSTRKIDTVFIVCLFVLFVITSCILLLIGAGQYRATTDTMNHNYEVRTTTSYLTEKIHQNDTSAGTDVVDFANGHALALKNMVDESTYTTYIYFYDGALRELFVGEGSVYTPDSGQIIVTLESFDVEFVRTGLIRAVFTDTDGISHTLYLDVHSTALTQRKENS